MRITVSDSVNTIAKNLSLVPGSSVNATLSGLPLGLVTVDANAYPSGCAAVTASSTPTWVSDPVRVTLSPGIPVPVKLVMEKPGQISVSVDWNTGGAGGNGGNGGMSGAGGAGGAGVGAMLDGQAFLAHCGVTQSYSDLVCVDFPASGVCASASEYLFSGNVIRNDSVTFDGDPATTYNVTVRVRGVVEPKHYNGCTLSFGKPEEGFGFGPTPAPGQMTGGCYPSTAGNYDVFMVRVSNPQRTYVFNALNHDEAHYSYPVDYTATMQIAGGAQVQFIASDSNCSEVKNCAATSQEGAGGLGRCDPITIPGLTDPRIAQPYNGQFLLMNLVSVTP